MEKETLMNAIDRLPEYVELTDGTCLYASAGYANGDLWVWMKDPDDNDNDICYLVELFTDNEKTAVVKYHSPGDVEQKWEGFNDLYTITKDADGRISVRMRKG